MFQFVKILYPARMFVFIIIVFSASTSCSNEPLLDTNEAEKRVNGFLLMIERQDTTPDSLLVSMLDEWADLDYNHHFDKLQQATQKLIDVGRLEPAMAINSKLLQFADKNNNTHRKIKILLTRFDMATMQMDNTIAGQYLDTILELQELHQFEDLTGNIHHAKATMAIYDNNFDVAIDELTEALLVYETTGDTVNLASVYHTIGSLFVNAQEYNKSIPYLKKAETLYSVADIRDELLLTQINLGVAYYRIDSTAIAQDYFSKLLLAYRETNNPLKLSQVFYNLGSLEKERGNYYLSLQYADSVISICEQASMEYGIILGRMLYAENLVKINRPEEALSMIEILKSLPVYSQNSVIRVKLLEIQYQAYNMLKDYKKELQYYRLFVELTDSLNKARAGTRVIQLEENVKKKSLENKILKMEAAQILVSAERRLTTFIFIIAILVLIFLLVFLWLKKRTHELKSRLAVQENTSLRQTIGSQDREIASKSLQMLQLHELRQKMLNMLKELKKSKDLAGNYDELINNLSSMISVNSWNEFEHHFAKVHAGFYQNLTHYCPDLTPAEVKVAGLMRLKLSSKEIAEIMNRSEGTIRNHRAVIRKKLKMESDENLMLFLMRL